MTDRDTVEVIGLNKIKQGQFVALIKRPWWQRMLWKPWVRYFARGI